MFRSCHEKSRKRDFVFLFFERQSGDTSKLRSFFWNFRIFHEKLVSFYEVEDNLNSIVHNKIKICWIPKMKLHYINCLRHFCFDVYCFKIMSLYFVPRKRTFAANETHSIGIEVGFMVPIKKRLQNLFLSVEISSFCKMHQWRTGILLKNQV